MPVPRTFILHATGVNLHEPNPSFEKTTGHQALAGDVIAFRITDPIKLVDMLRLVGKIERLGGFALHPKRQFKALDAGCKIALRGMALEMHLIQLRERIELLTLDGRGQ